MIHKFHIAMMLVCFLGISAPAQADKKTPNGWEGTYKLKDRKGYLSATGVPRCDASAEEILDRWRGLLVIEYSKGAVSVNGESWISDPAYLWCLSVYAHRPPDPSIPGRINISFHTQGRDRRGVALLVYSDESAKCLTSIAFAGERTKP